MTGCSRLQRVTEAKPETRAKPLERRDLIALFEADLRAMTEALVRSEANG